MATTASALFYGSQGWKELRTDALRRDHWTCTVPGCRARATHVDHIRRRPHSPTPTAEDVLTNLRSLCAAHDAQMKELASGERRNAGNPRVIGCDAAGWPLDPTRR